MHYKMFWLEILQKSSYSPSTKQQYIILLSISSQFFRTSSFLRLPEISGLCTFFGSSTSLGCLHFWGHLLCWGRLHFWVALLFAFVLSVGVVSFLRLSSKILQKSIDAIRSILQGLCSQLNFH